MSSTAARSPVVGAPTPGSAYVQQQRLVKRYEQAVSSPDVDIEELMAAIWGSDLSQEQMYGTAGSDGFIDRIDEHGPELILLMGPAEMGKATALLSAGDLPAAVRYILSLHRALKNRVTDPRAKEYKRLSHLEDWEEDPRRCHNDQGRLRAAGLGLRPTEAARPLAGMALVQHNARRVREGLDALPAPPPELAAARRREREAARLARQKQARSGAASLPVAVPVVVLVPMAQVFPAAPPRKWQPWHGQQLAFWPVAAPGGLR